MQIPILNGIYTDSRPELRTSYPVNLVPVPKDSGLNRGYLRPADGIVEHATGPGIDRGGIMWNGVHYRVMGSKLVTVSATVTVIGDVEDDGQPVSMDYGPDRLAIASNGKLFYWDGSDLVEVTDPDIGAVLDVLWVDGYFMTTDGEFLVVTELLDPTAVNPLKYGSSEADPDPVNALLKLRNEVLAMNRFTIEYFDNVGGDLFPFARIEGAQVEKGTLGVRTCCILSESAAFMGGGFNEAISVYIAGNANTIKISTQEIDDILRTYSEDVLAASILEARKDGSHEFLYVHLPDRTLVYDAGASIDLGEPVWFTLSSGSTDLAQYRLRDIVWTGAEWIGGDPQVARLGRLDDTLGSHYGAHVHWEFGTTVLYNEGMGAVFHELELIALTGAGEGHVSTSYSIDGEVWSMEQAISVGSPGQRAKRLVWFRQGHMRNWRVQRFRGSSLSRIAPIRLEAKLEALAW